MSRPSIYRLLEVPLLYRTLLRIVGAANLKEFHAANASVYNDVDGLVLDVGCGPSLLSPKPRGTLVGLDINFDYLQQFQDIEDSDTKVLVTNGSAFELPFPDDAFDETRCAAVLHHLSDEQAAKALEEMHRVTRPEGRVVIFDFVVPDRRFRYFFAWLVTQLDRGEYVRKRMGLYALYRNSSLKNWEIREFRYSWLELHGTLSTAVLSKTGE